jgi:SecD/SecF fusion protein
MQNKNAIWLFTILLGLACLYQISFSWATAAFEGKAETEANYVVDSVLTAEPNLSLASQDSVRQASIERYLTANGNNEVYPVIGYTYNECKEKEINLGLDLKGGMSVTLEVSIPEMVENLAANGNDADFQKALALAKEKQKNSQSDYLTLFNESYNEVAPTGKLAGIFHSRDNKELFPAESTNEQIITILREEAIAAIDNTERILRTRIDKFGVTQPTIQKQQYSGRIQIELPGVKDKSRVRKVLQSTANLEFWETFENKDVYPLLNQINDRIADRDYPGLRAEVETRLSASDSLLTNDVDTAAAGDELEDLLSNNDSVDQTAPAASNSISEVEQRKLNPLFSALSPAIFQGANGQFQIAEGSVVGYARTVDTSAVNKVLADKLLSTIVPRDMLFMWDAKSNNEVVALHAIKVSTRDGKAVLDGSVIVDASQDFNYRGDVEVTMQMNSEGAKAWAKMTRENVGNRIAIVLDKYIQSAPVVNGEIPNGRSSISMGTGTRAEQIREAEDLSNILKAGALPAPATIVDEAVVGPSLGAANISSGLMSFGIAFVMILLYMVFYYRGAGVVSDIALIANLFFLVGVLASVGASLTLPGIAGIVLTIGMSVDANVLIYERIREELRNGSDMKGAISRGYSKAYAAIIDANLTTLLTAIVLAVFGSGPIKGFATTLIIGIFTSLFSAIFITRLIITYRADRNLGLSFSSKATSGWFLKAAYKFVDNRKKFYIISGLLITMGVISMGVRGFNFGVDFTGGRTYTVKFDEIVPLDDVRNNLSDAFGKATAEVKTLGSANQVKVTTNYLVDQNSTTADAQAEEKLNIGLEKLGTAYEVMESRKVDPTISDDIAKSAYLAIGFSLIIIFGYIVLRFRKWQYGLGALIAMFHDVLLVLSAYSLLHGFVPFSLEIDQAFIAAILTVVGYSINDTVVVFDRIREFLGMKKKGTNKEIINEALNSTLSRTINTSLTTLVVLIMIFVFGGESIRGFVFALMIGVFFGTYSSICIASPSVIDLDKKNAE